MSSPRPDNRCVLVRLARVKALILHATEHLGNYSARATVATLAEKLEVSQKTIYRDLEVLRDQLGHEIEYDERRHTFFYRTVPVPVL